MRAEQFQEGNEAPLKTNCRSYKKELFIFRALYIYFSFFYAQDEYTRFRILFFLLFQVKYLAKRSAKKYIEKYRK